MLFGHNFDIGQVCNYFKLKVSYWWCPTLLTTCSHIEGRSGYILWATWIRIHWEKRDCGDWRTNWKVRVKFLMISYIDFYSLVILNALNHILYPYPPRITKFVEKPQSHETTSRLASPVFYCLRRDTLKLVSEYTDQHTNKTKRALGMFMVSLFLLTLIVVQKWYLDCNLA